MKGTAYIFAQIDTDLMQVKNVSVMSDGNPTLCGQNDSYLLIEKVEFGNNYGEARAHAVKSLLPGGHHHDRWYGIWVEREHYELWKDSK